DPRAPGLAADKRLQTLIDRVKLEQRKMRTLEARFVQRQESSMLLQPEESQGTFSYAAPDKVRWEYTAPNPISIVILGDQMTTWYRDLNRADRFKVGRYSNQVFEYLGAKGSMERLKEYFTVYLHTPGKRGNPFKLRLDPRFARIRKRLKQMEIWIDDTTYLPVRLRYVEADGDTTEYEFRDVKLNAAIPAERFVLKLPKGVEVREREIGRGRESKG
ncbi:MAG TPA: outer membrane lipoprotein carrier protein LolA, partial [Thermoanaerobaculia bacterium]|nr:outer membrane lipoprotein carrier protein LolA [Thermoanaerobaculia bacterium]